MAFSNRSSTARRSASVSRSSATVAGGTSGPRGGAAGGWVVQAALKLVLEPIFETDFEPVSYGFRPARRAHDTIAEIHLFGTQEYRWVLDADIKACFDRIDHADLMDRVRHRIKDKRVLRLVNWQRIRHRWNWTDVRRWLTDPTGRWHPISADGITLFNPAAVPIRRYRYRGNTIPTPWTQAV